MDGTRRKQIPYTTQLNQFNELVQTFDDQADDLLKSSSDVRKRPELQDTCLQQLETVVQTFQQVQKLSCEIILRAQKQGSSHEAGQLAQTKLNCKFRIQTLIDVCRPLLPVDWPKLLDHLELSSWPNRVEHEPQNTHTYDEVPASEAIYYSPESPLGPSAFSTPICSVNLPPSLPPRNTMSERPRRVSSPVQPPIPLLRGSVPHLHTRRVFNQPEMPTSPIITTTIAPSVQTKSVKFPSETPRLTFAQLTQATLHVPRMVTTTGQLSQTTYANTVPNAVSEDQNTARQIKAQHANHMMTMQNLINQLSAQNNPPFQPTANVPIAIQNYHHPSAYSSRNPSGRTSPVTPPPETSATPNPLFEPTSKNNESCSITYPTPILSRSVQSQPSYFLNPPPIPPHGEGFLTSLYGTSTSNNFSGFNPNSQLPSQSAPASYPNPSHVTFAPAPPSQIHQSHAYTPHYPQTAPTLQTAPQNYPTMPSNTRHTTAQHHAIPASNPAVPTMSQNQQYTSPPQSPAPTPPIRLNHQQAYPPMQSPIHQTQHNLQQNIPSMPVNPPAPMAPTGHGAAPPMMGHPYPGVFYYPQAVPPQHDWNYTQRLKDGDFKSLCFKGDPAKFRYWQREIHRRITEANITDPQVILDILANNTASRPKQLIDQISSSGNRTPHAALQAAWQLLEEKYGSEHQAADALLTEVRRFKPIREAKTDSEIHSLEDLHLLCTRILLASQTHIHSSWYTSETGIQMLHEKTPPAFQLRWRKRHTKLQLENRPITLHEFTALLKEYVAEVSNPAFRDLSVKTKTKTLLTNPKSSAPSKPPKQERKPTATQHSNRPTRSVNPKPFNRAFDANKPRCAACPGENHLTRNCDKFKSMSDNQRMTAVKENNHCIRCLRFGHPIRSCPQDWTCFHCGKDSHNSWLCTKPQNQRKDPERHTSNAFSNTNRNSPSSNPNRKSDNSTKSNENSGPPAPEEDQNVQ